MSVSVVIPSFNRAHLITAAIESALQQTWRGRLEIIVVDDGSSDGTAAVVGRFGERVRYFRQENRGCGAARNVGLAAATGDYVAFLDSDDRWLPFKLSAQVALCQARRDVALVFGDFVIEKPDGEIQAQGASRWAGRPLDFAEMQPFALPAPADGGRSGWPAAPLPCFVGPMYRQLLDELPILTSSVLVRRDALDGSMRYAEGVKLFEDWTFFAQVARRHAIGYLAVPTAVNVGHADPGRVSHCDALTRAHCYVSLLERVWEADAAFTRTHGAALRAAKARGLLAVARHALLDANPGAARQALGRWRALRVAERRGWASLFELCASVPGGRQILRQALRGQTAWQLLTGTRREYHPVNPAV